MRKAVFLDKDGTLIEDVPYNVDPGKIRLTKGAGQGLKLLQAGGFTLIVVSNQPGVAKGYFTFSDIKKAEAALSGITAGFGVRLDAFYYCPHHPEGTRKEFSISCSCRKPAPGLIITAAKEHDIDLEHSWLVGDILNDIEAGRRAGCRTILIDNGNETEWIPAPTRSPHHIVSDLEEAARIICEFKEKD
jgi:D-glycero-D-manno-heptose 1,7-bisphosphate phosphatase